MYTHLPANYTVRPPVEEDIQPIIDLIYAYETSENGSANRFTSADIRADWEYLDLKTDAWCILSPEGFLAAYGVLWCHDAASYGRLTGDGYVHPAYAGRGLGSTLLDLMEARAAEIEPTLPENTRLVLANSIIANSAASRALFEARGYSLTRVYFNMEIAFAEEPAAPICPTGIEIRACDGSRDDIRQAYEVIEEAFQDHFMHTPHTFEEWQQFMVREDFDPSLWFLAMDGDTTVGAILCQVRDQEADLGVIPRLAVLPSWRKRGLGTALLHHAFGVFYRRGFKRVILGVDSQSLTGAQRLYEQVGMRVAMRIGRYEKELRPGRELHPGRVD